MAQVRVSLAGLTKNYSIQLLNVELTDKFEVVVQAEDFV